MAYSYDRRTAFFGGFSVERQLEKAARFLDEAWRSLATIQTETEGETQRLAKRSADRVRDTRKAILTAWKGR